VLASIMGGGEEAAAVLEKLRSTAEDDQVEEEELRSWCREQQEVRARYRGGIRRGRGGGGGHRAGGRIGCIGLCVWGGGRQLPLGR
jgi:hypothetical protein